MNTIDKTFQFEGAQFRAVGTPDAPEFIAADWANALNYSSTAAMTRTLDDDEKGVHTLHTPGGAQQMTTITEAGLYSVILRSRVPQAKAFKRWVTHEVLPAIRSTGSYGGQLELTDDEIVQRALQITAAKVKQLEAKVEEDAPKVDYFEQCVAPTDDIVTVRVAASHVGIPENLFRESMIAAGWIYRLKIGTRWSATEQRLKDEFEYRAKAAHADKFSLRAQHNAPRHHNGQVRQTLYIVAASLPAFVRRFGKETTDAIAA